MTRWGPVLLRNTCRRKVIDEWSCCSQVAVASPIARVSARSKFARRTFPGRHASRTTHRRSSPDGDRRHRCRDILRPCLPAERGTDRGLLHPLEGTDIQWVQWIDEAVRLGWHKDDDHSELSTTHFSARIGERNAPRRGMHRNHGAGVFPRNLSRSTPRIASKRDCLGRGQPSIQSITQPAELNRHSWMFPGSIRRAACRCSI